MGLPAERQAAMVRTLATIDDPQERLTVALSWKNTLEPLAVEDRVEGNRVVGCVSRVWLVSRQEGERCRFRIDAESPLVRGLVSLLVGIYDGATAEEVIGEEPVALDELGLLRNLSPTRQNGMAAVRQALVTFAALAAGKIDVR